ncbi:hypothetical protein T439DRAFT_355103 [Meredithblackwellia eburnea MCA 4105]
MPSSTNFHSVRTSGRTYESDMMLSMGPKADPVSRSSRRAPAPEGLAISYDLSPPPPSTYFNNDHLGMNQAAMGWEKNDVPIPRDNARKKPFTKAYDPVSDTSTRLDSVLDAYANMYVDYAQEDSPVVATPEPEVQRREPWDTRGKTGLYGGGGRGADDSETGWVSDYAMQRKDSRQGEEDLQYEDAPTPKMHNGTFTDDRYGHRDERRRSSSETQSSYGPVTPVSATFDGYQDQPFRAPVGKMPTNGAPSRPVRGADSQPAEPVPLLNQTRNSAKSGRTRSQSRPGSRPVVAPAERPAIPTRSPASSVTAPTQSPSEPGRLRKKTISQPAGAPHPTISAPISAPQATVPPAAEVRERPVSTDEGKRRKSVTASFRWSGRSKKAPVISNPILPEGFVESLGMETFALTPGCSAPAHDAPPKQKKKEKEATPAPRPKKQPPVRPSAPTGTAELVRTPMDALRDAGASTPNEFRREINDAFKRLSDNSDVSYTPPSNRSSSDQDRRKYFNNMREDMSKPATEVQANRGPRTSSRAQGLPQQQHSRPSNPPVSAKNQGGAYAQSHNQEYSTGNSDSYGGKSWSRGHQPQQSMASAHTVQPNNYRGNNNYGLPAADESPIDQSDDFDDRNGGGTSASDYSGYSDASPGLRSPEGVNAFQGYSPAVNDYNSYGDSNYLAPKPTQPLNLRRPSAVPVELRQSVAGSVVWGGSTPAQPSQPSPPPMPFKQQETIPGGLFRNPFEAVSNQGGPVRSGWQ